MNMTAATSPARTGRAPLALFAPFALFALLAPWATACEAERGQQDAHGHEHGYQHAEAHPEGHDHHAEGHGHGAAVVGITAWSTELELFAEHAVAVAGQPFELLAHLTVLDGFRAPESGAVQLRLTGPAEVAVSAAQPESPGIYRLQVVAPEPGTYRASLSIAGTRVQASVAGFEIAVHADATAATAAMAAMATGDDHGEHDDHDEAHINFLKEQQWKVDFATAFATEGEVVPAVQVPGTVVTPPGGLAEVSAPVAGRLAAPPGGWLRPGAEVRAGTLLAALAPAPESAEGGARARLAVVEAGARVRAADANLARAQRLFADEAISKRELEDAQREASLAVEAKAASGEVAALFQSARSGRGGGRWRLTSPISGVLVTADANPGAAVAPGQVLFRIVDRSELWIRARVPEQDAARLQPGRGASYAIAGLPGFTPLRVDGPDANASLVTISPVVDPRTRSVEVVHALSNPPAALRVGGLLTLELPVGAPWRGIVVPRDAVVQEGGRMLVYVQVDGEHFEERAVRSAVATASHIGIVEGLSAGQRIVTRGANLLRLTARSASGEPAHGHIH